MQDTNYVVSPDECNEYVEKVAGLIKNDSGFVPDTILALSTGGFPIAAFLAKRLNIVSRNVVGLPVYKDEQEDHHLDDALVTLGNCEGRKVLVVDEASHRGLLTRKAVDAVTERGGRAKSCVLIAWEGGIQPDFVAITCKDKPPKFYWEPPVS